MSYEGAAGAGYEVVIEGAVKRWGRGDISVKEIRELGELPPDCKMVAIDLVSGEKQPLDEDYVHEIPPLDPNKPDNKRTNFACA